ncbi:hypothetical protein B0H14DRAFT_3773326 [Mycena olivaceomarginata]|nr:hypothetical protein B0H14DRAFT_3773326 [Mycena olivaceomarginata]
MACSSTVLPARARPSWPAGLLHRVTGGRQITSFMRKGADILSKWARLTPALEEAEYEDAGGESGALEREMTMQGIDGLSACVSSAAFKLPAVFPTTRCHLKLLKMERIKDYLLLEEEFIQNQERLKFREDVQAFGAHKTAHISDILERMSRFVPDPKTLDAIWRMFGRLVAERVRAVHVWIGPPAQKHLYLGCYLEGFQAFLPTRCRTRARCPRQLRRDVGSALGPKALVLILRVFRCFSSPAAKRVRAVHVSPDVPPDRPPTQKHLYLGHPREVY